MMGGEGEKERGRRGIGGMTEKLKNSSFRGFPRSPHLPLSPSSPLLISPSTENETALGTTPTNPHK
jgi:hypothetical protein